MSSEAKAASGAVTRVLASHNEAIEAVRELLPRIADRAPTVDRERGVSAETIRELEEAGLFGVLTPKAYGGSALGWKTFFSVVSELGSVCGSTAWTYGVLTGHNHLLTRFPEAVQERLLSDPAQHVSVVFRLTEPFVATAKPGGGYVLSGGQGRFCSGLDFAKWVGVTATIKGGPNDGQFAFCLAEKDKLGQIDDWQTMGMRGTGSRSIDVDGVEVAEEMTALAVNAGGPAVGPAAEEGGFFTWSYLAIAPLAILGAPVGAARGLLRETLKMVNKRLKGLDDELVATHSATFYRLSRAAQDLDAAELLLMRDFDLIDGADFSSATPLDFARIRRDTAAAAQLARHAAASLMEAAGASSIYEKAGIERMFRDVNAGAAHFAFMEDGVAPNYGRALLGLPPARTNAFVR